MLPHNDLSQITRRAWARHLAMLAVAPAVLPAARLRGGASSSVDDTAFPNWSDEFVDRVLSNSPWARQFTAKSGIAEFFPVLRWSGALPVRRALALAQFGRAEAPAMVAPRSEDEIVVELGGVPTMMVRGDASRLEDELLRTARLYHKDRKPLSPNSVSVPPHGMHLAATMRFPRWETPLTADDGEIGFLCQAAGARIDLRFKLRSMVYEGALVL